MNYIEQMVAELCPNGVEFRELGNCIKKNVGGGTPSRGNPSYWNGNILWASVGDLSIPGNFINTTRATITTEGLSNSSSNIVPCGDVIVAVKISPGKMKIAAADIAMNQDLRGLSLKDFLDSSFLTYYFQTISIIGNGTIVKGITNDTLERIRIPVPPLPIQQEIVRVLDLFMALQANLQAELVARRKQYQYYRDQLLSFEGRKDVRWGTLGEMFDMRAGHHISAQNIIAEPDQSHLYPCFGGNGVRGFVEKFSHDGAYLLIGRQGALCGNVQRARGKFYATEHAVVVTASAEINVDWAFHMLTLMNLNQYASKSAQPGLAVGKLAELRIAVPPLAEQEEIAGILDKFDALVNDLSIGLPAEIAARQKQYEYYRDRLLTFPEAG